MVEGKRLRNHRQATREFEVTKAASVENALRLRFGSCLASCAGPHR